MMMFKTSTLTFLLAFASLATAVAPYVRYRGCYSDSSSARALHEFVGRSSAMTVETCQSMCANTKGGATTFAGLEYGGECFCGNAVLNQHRFIAEDACSMPCTGNAGKTCGGPGALSIYQTNGGFSEGSASILTSFKDWKYSGCWQDSPQGRQISQRQNLPREFMTVETCLDVCSAKGYKIAGLQYSEECWCGNGPLPTGPQLSDTACSLQCTNNAQEYCGGNNANSLYLLPGAGSPRTCTVSCPKDISTLSRPNLRLVSETTNVEADSVYCRYVSGFYQGECEYRRLTGALIGAYDQAPCPSTTTCTYQT